MELTRRLLVFQMPVLEMKSNAKPSMFAYPPAVEVAKKEEKERVATAILSVCFYLFTFLARNAPKSGTKFVMIQR